jgi:hypothetical protein
VGAVPRASDLPPAEVASQAGQAEVFTDSSKRATVRRPRASIDMTPDHTRNLRALQVR